MGPPNQGCAMLEECGPSKGYDGPRNVEMQLLVSGVAKTQTRTVGTNTKSEEALRPQTEAAGTDTENVLFNTKYSMSDGFQERQALRKEMQDVGLNTDSHVTGYAMYAFDTAVKSMHVPPAVASAFHVKNVAAATSTAPSLGECMHCTDGTDGLTEEPRSVRNKRMFTGAGSTDRCMTGPAPVQTPVPAPAPGPVRAPALTSPPVTAMESQPPKRTSTNKKFFIYPSPYRIANQRILELEAQVEDLQEKSSAASDENSSGLRKELKEHMQKCKDLDSQLQMKKARLEELEPKLESSKDQIKDLEERLSKKENDMKMMEERYKRYLEKAKSVSVVGWTVRNVFLWIWNVHDIAAWHHCWTPLHVPIHIVSPCGLVQHSEWLLLVWFVVLVVVFASLHVGPLQNLGSNALGEVSSAYTCLAVRPIQCLPLVEICPFSCSLCAWELCMFLHCNREAVR